jgi:hypothetical protein
VAVTYDDPLQFLMAVMNNTGEDIDVRKDAAKAMLPYIHPKKGETGKKDAKNAAAKVPLARENLAPWLRQSWWSITRRVIHGAVVHGLP